MQTTLSVMNGRCQTYSSKCANYVGMTFSGTVFDAVYPVKKRRIEELYRVTLKKMDSKKDTTMQAGDLFLVMCYACREEYYRRFPYLRPITKELSITISS